MSIEKRKRKPNTWVDKPRDMENRIYSEGAGMIGDEEIEILKKVIAEKVFTWGRFVDQFENDFADYLGVKYAYTVSNCTTALTIASKLIGLKPGDEVITTPITFIATGLGPLDKGAKIVFADIDPRTYNISPEEIEKNITDKTKAVYIVHLEGQPCDMDPIMEVVKKHKLYLIEDCAHAPGAEYKGRKVGTFGDFGCFSFHARKNMVTLGEGGMLTTNSDKFGEEIPTIRCIGTKKFKEPITNELTGESMMSDTVAIRGEVPNNYRMNDAQAAVGIVQLKKLEMLTKRREEIASYYSEELSRIEGITPPYYMPECKPAYHRYTALFDEKKTGVTRIEVNNKIKEKGISTGGRTYLPIYLYSIYKERGYKKGLCPNAEKMYIQSFMLPIYPELQDRQMKMVIDTVKEALVKKGSK